MKLTHEMIQKARGSKSAEELLQIAKEYNIELTDDEAATYFKQMHSAELDDDLLDGVAGGWIVGGSGEENATEVLRKKSSRSQCE